MKRSCLICKKIEQIKTKKNPYFVKELKTGFVVLEDYQYYKGYVLFLSKIHARELHELDGKFLDNFLKEMSFVAKTVSKTFKPQKLNYELLGNSMPHLHWHIIPRYRNDLNIKQPIWTLDKHIRRSKKLKENNLKNLKKIKSRILKNLDK